MKLLALLLGLLLERVSTNVFGLREIRWLDGYFDRALAFMGEGQGLRAYLVAIVTIALVAQSFRIILKALFAK